MKKNQKEKLPSRVLMALMAWVSFMWILLGRQSLRLDESQSLWTVHYSWEGMLNTIARDVHVPLYFILLKLWLELTEWSVVSARSFSLLWTLLSLPLAYALGRATGSKKLAVLATVLYAISPFVHWYSSEVRMYSFVLFLATAHVYAFYSLIRGRKKYVWPLSIITLLLGIYAHYFFWFLLIADGVAYIFYRKQRAGLDIRFWIMTGLAFASFVPWLVFVERQPVRLLSEPLLGVPSAVDVFITVFQFVIGFLDPDLNSALMSLWPALILALFFTLSRRELAPRALLYPALVFVLPIVGTVLVSYLYRPVYAARYLVVVLPGFVLLLGWLIIVLGKKVGRIVLILLVVIASFLSLRQSMIRLMPLKEDFAQASAVIIEEKQPGDILYVSAPFVTYPMEYYSDGGLQIKTVPHWDRFTETAIPVFSAPVLAEEMNRDMAVYARAWLVTAYDQGYEADIVGAFNSRFTLISRRSFSGVDVYLYEL